MNEELVKELCEEPCLDRSLKALFGLSRGFGSSSCKYRASVCVGTKGH
jgi:hypothetical protein